MSNFVKVHKAPYAALASFVASKPLVGKTAVVTGAGKGVGAHIAQQLAAGGISRLGILGRDKTRIEAAQKRYSAEFPEITVEAFAIDVTDESAVSSFFSSFGVPVILVNNAGVFPDSGPFIEEDLRQWFTGFEVNLLGTATVTQQFLRAKGPDREAIVLNVSTLAAHFRIPLIGWSGYGSSKLAQARLFEHLRFEHPEVRFINIHPGQIKSDGFSTSGAPEPAEGMTDGILSGQFYVWAATEEAAFLSGRFAWAEWDIDELKLKRDEIVNKDLLLVTFEGIERGN